MVFFWLSAAAIAGGGSRKEIPKAESSDPLLATMSVEEAGVGGGLARGILSQERLAPLLNQ